MTHRDRVGTPHQLLELLAIDRAREPLGLDPILEHIVGDLGSAVAASLE
jgi:hypothetical protein